MGIGVGGSIKDGVPVKEQLEAAKISAHGEHGQQSCDGKREPSPGQRRGQGKAACKCA